MLDETTANSRIPSTALFNKLNGVFYGIAYLPIEQSAHDPALYEARSVMFNSMEDFIDGQLIVNKDGSYTDAFEVVKLADRKEQIYERQLNMMAEQKITKRYPLIDQVNLLVKAIQRLAQEHDFNDLPEFQALSEMTSYIGQVLETNAAKKEFYRENPDVDYYSDERVEAEESARYEGGIHEAIGPRAVTGGRIFGTQRS